MPRWTEKPWSVLMYSFFQSDGFSITALEPLL